MGDGSAESLSGVYCRYITRLCGLAERLIGERLRRQYSAEDAAHSALASFYRGIDEGQFCVESSDKLWSLLASILRHKIQKRGRRIRDLLLVDERESDDRRPSHEEAVELADAMEAALAGFKLQHVEICRLHYQEGLGVGETAVRVGCSRWTVRRVLARFRQRLKSCLTRDKGT